TAEAAPNLDCSAAVAWAAIGQCRPKPMLLLPLWERVIIIYLMRVLSRKTLHNFWEMPAHRNAEQPLKAWFREALKARWANSAAVKAAYRSASIVANNRVVFNVAGNKYRLV